jgi:hypothetical protein
MYQIKHVFRVTIIDNNKKLTKVFPNYKKAFSFSGDYLIQKYSGFSWSRNLKQVIKFTEVKKSDEYKQSVFIEEGFKKKVNKSFQIFIDEIFYGTEKIYPIGKNIHTKHSFKVEMPGKLLEFNSRSYKIGYYKVGNYFQKISDLNWSFGLNYMLEGYEKTPFFIRGQMKHKIGKIKVLIKSI